MTPAQRRFLLVDQTLGTAAITGLINAAIAWATFRNATTVPLWGLNGIAADLLATGLLLPFLVCVISTSLARRQLRSGKLTPMPLTRSDLGALGRLPAGARRRGVALGLVGLATVAPLTIGALLASGKTSLPTGQFIALKTVFATVLAGVVGPLVGVWALLSDAEPSHDGGEVEP